jgi:hypothetical protein
MFVLMLFAAAAAESAPAPANPDNVVRCVRENITGTVAQSRRVCHTVGEWRRIRRDSADEARRVVMPEGRPNVSPGG